MKLLPTDVVFHVLDQLTVAETEQLITNLNAIDHVTDLDRKYLNELVIISYQRIYRGRFTVYSNMDSHNVSRFDKAMGFGEFGALTRPQAESSASATEGGASTGPGPGPSSSNTGSNTGSDFNENGTQLDRQGAGTGTGSNTADLAGQVSDGQVSGSRVSGPSGLPASRASDVFRSTRPKHIEFVFIRQPNDYRQFVTDLNSFTQMIEAKDSPYLNQVLQYGLYINGNCVAIEPTTSFLVSILKVLIAISSQLSHKFTRISIKSTDIGQYYIGQWCQLFSRFTTTQYLDLSDNLIRLELHHEPDLNDILATFEWPPNLVYLNLNKNFISHVSREFLERLPESLEVLILSNNWVGALGLPVPGLGLGLALARLPLALTLALAQAPLVLGPNLKVLELSYNTALTYINPLVFGQVGKGFRLGLRGCNVGEENMREIGMVARGRFIIEI